MNQNELITAAVRSVSAVRGESQGAVAAVIGVSQQQVNARMRGRTRWQLVDLELLGAHWGLEPVDLMRGPIPALLALAEHGAIEDPGAAEAVA